MNIFEKKLFAQGQKENLLFWEIEVDYNDLEDAATLIITHGKVGGSEVEHIETIEAGLAGRSVREQALLRANARLSSKIDAGYVESMSEALSTRRTNSLGLPRQMLAQVYDNNQNNIDFSKRNFMQRKYNGHRASVINTGSELIMYTRRGKIVDTCPHILEAIEIPVGVMLDGELYAHGLKLQKISSLVKKKQPETELIKFKLFDAMLPNNAGFDKRIDFLNSLEFAGDGKVCEIAETYPISEMSEVIKLTKQFIDEGYEGGILRRPGFGYEDGKRSKSVLKVKMFKEDDFLVIGIRQSKDGWAILDCADKFGREFSASAPGNMVEKHKVYDQRKEYIGKYVKISYPEFTERGVPFQPVALEWVERL